MQFLHCINLIKAGDGVVEEDENRGYVAIL
jgi:hypothetical protein